MESVTPTAVPVRAYVKVVEGARGLAAFYILFHHAILLANAHEAFSENLLLRMIRDVSAAFTIHILMLFFLLSGFAIHYANAGRITRFDPATIKKYLYKRLRRIYPIYALAVILSLLAIVILGHLGAGDRWPFPTRLQLAGTLFFFSDLSSRSGTWIPTLSTNGPLWSLSYEVLYYLLYPVFSVVASRYGFRKALLISSGVSMAAIAFAVAYHPTQITNMLSLYVLWCLGAYLAEIKLHSKLASFKGVFVFFVLVGLAQSLWIFESFLMWRIPLSFSLYAGLFIFALMLFLIRGVSADRWSFIQRWTGFSFLVFVSAGTAAFAYTFHTTDNYEFLVFRVLVVFILGVAWLSGAPGTLFKWLRSIAQRWESTGFYSYGLYILQFPILIIGFVAAQKFLGQPLWGLLALVPVVFVAIFVERRVQPFIAKRMDALLLSAPTANRWPPRAEMD